VSDFESAYEQVIDRLEETGAKPIGTKHTSPESCAVVQVVAIKP